jgi:hypothetical protein
MIGQTISQSLVELEGLLIDFEINVQLSPSFTDEGFRAAIHIFAAAVLQKAWELTCKEEMDMEIRNNFALKCGEDISKLVKTYTGIDTTKIYDNYTPK